MILDRPRGPRTIRSLFVVPTNTIDHSTAVSVRNVLTHGI